MNPKPDNKQLPTVQLGISWVRVEGMPVQPANVFLTQLDGSGFFVTFGLAAPPAPSVGREPEDTPAYAEGLEVIEVEPVARVFVTPDKLEEFVAMLSDSLRRYKRFRAEGGDSE